MSKEKTVKGYSNKELARIIVSKGLDTKGRTESTLATKVNKAELVSILDTPHVQTQSIKDEAKLHEFDKMLTLGIITDAQYSQLIAPLNVCNAVPVRNHIVDSALGGAIAEFESKNVYCVIGSGLTKSGTKPRNSSMMFANIRNTALFTTIRTSVDMKQGNVVLTASNTVNDDEIKGLVHEYISKPQAISLCTVIDTIVNDCAIKRDAKRIE